MKAFWLNAQLSLIFSLTLEAIPKIKLILQQVYIISHRKGNNAAQFYNQ